MAHLKTKTKSCSFKHARRNESGVLNNRWSSSSPDVRVNVQIHTYTRPIYDPSRLIHRPRSTHTHTHTHTHSHTPQLNIILSFHMQSYRVIDGTGDWETVGQRVQQPRITSLSSQQRQEPLNMCQALVHLAIKGSGRRQIGLINALPKTHPWLIQSLNPTSAPQIILRLTGKMDLDTS